jgi:hypothetical protein
MMKTTSVQPSISIYAAAHLCGFIITKAFVRIFFKHGKADNICVFSCVGSCRDRRGAYARART